MPPGCRMNNVIQMFESTNAETVRSESDIAAAKARFFAKREELRRTVREFSRQADSLEDVFGRIEDTETRVQLTEQMKRGRETISKAVLELSRNVEAIARSG
jgi:hypothetical protein